jgi:predicted nucleic acid-binding protein
VLAKAGHLHLLKDLPRELLLPEAVIAEICAGPETDPARQAIESGWGPRITPAGVPDELLEWGLGLGETAVLATALERRPCTAVLNDAAGRNCAKAFGIPLIGTLGVVLRAKKRGLIANAGDVLKDLRIAGLHLDDHTIRMALGRLGETW